MPFGAQYYRAPTPKPSEWKSDMVAMRAAGFNTIKIWAQWRWNQPAEDEFYFDDLDQLMDLAHDHGLNVVINTILDCAPAWLYRKYPDCVMTTAYGRKVGPASLPHRQIGGAPGPCFHHREAMSHLRDFIAETAKRYAQHPALYAWDLWNEPELTVGMLREAKVENLVCYCGNSRLAFLKWLEDKYADIEHLNACWHRNYRCWDEVELPVEPTTFKDMVDWRMFFVDTVTQNMKLRAAKVRQIDTTHPIMCHTVPTPHFNPITCASDDWLLSECCDVFGNSVGSDPMAADIMRAAARGKTVINAEIHAIPGGTFYRPMPIGMEEMKKHILVPLAHGIKGFLFWQYRPETVGAESPAWGLTFPDGRPAPWLDPVSKICRELTSRSDFFMNAERAQPQVALFVSPENEIFCWSASGSTNIHNNSVSGAYRALYRANFSIDFLHPRDILAGVLSQHSVMYMPLPYWVDSQVLDTIKEWVRAGGHVISECCLGQVNAVDGCHSMTTPGSGLHELFGVREGLVYPESGVFNSYAWQTEGEAEGIRFSLSRAVGNMVAATTVPGCQMGAVLEGQDVDVLARYPTGEAAVTTTRFGSGTATMIGTLLGAACVTKPGTASADLIAALADACCHQVKPKALPAGDVRVDVLSGPGGRWVMVQNLSDREISASVELPVPPKSSPLEMLTNEPAVVSDSKMHVDLRAGQVRAYWVLD